MVCVSAGSPLSEDNVDMLETVETVLVVSRWWSLSRSLELRVSASSTPESAAEPDSPTGGGSRGSEGFPETAAALGGGGGWGG